MTTSIILRTTSLLISTLFMVFSFFLLLRGHNEPGGGFAGGLVAASAFTLYALAYGPAAARANLHMQPRTLIAAGLLLAAGSGVVGLVYGDAFLTGIWWTLDMFNREVKLGTPLFFDVGVYITVIGVTTMLVFALAEEGD